MSVDVPPDRFEALVADALDGIPEELGRRMENVVISVRDRPPVPGLLGRYEGIPHGTGGVRRHGHARPHHHLP
jgi:predicted Zn-dependent protease with MMP-like domain